MDALRDYMRHYSNNDIAAWSAAVDAMSKEDRALIEAYHDAFDNHATKNSGLLADLTDAIYGKGTAETRGYPRGMVAKVKRVFGRLRRVKRDERGDDELDCFGRFDGIGIGYGWQDLRPLLKEVK